MIVCLSYNSQSAPQAQKLINRIGELGEWPEKFLLCRENSAPELSGFPLIAQLTSYPDRANHHPESKNLAFQAVASFVQERIKEPFLYLETDCVPTSSDWWEQIANEYQDSGKRFMGAFVPASIEHSTPPHMSAIAVYPWDLIGNGAGEALIANEIPFPAAIARAVVPNMHRTSLIVHDWEGNGVPVDCVLYHPDRNGSVIEAYSVDQVAEMLNQPLPEQPALLVPAGGAIINTFPENMGKTHPKPWESHLDSINHIKFLCRELKKYCTAPKHTSYVRDELKTFRVVVGRKKVRRKKRRGLGDEKVKFRQR